MAASASPSPSGSGGGGGGGDGANRSSNGNSAAGQVKRDNSAVAAKMKHNPGIATEWSADEQAILDDGMKRFHSFLIIKIKLLVFLDYFHGRNCSILLFSMATTDATSSYCALLMLFPVHICLRYASEANIVRYAKIAMQLPKKTIRDVALRCIWMNKKEISKRRKDENWRKNKDKGEKLTDPSSKSRQPASWPTMHTYSLQSLSFDNDDDISYKGKSPFYYVSSLYVALTSPVSLKLAFVAPESYAHEKIPGNYFSRWTNCRDFQIIVAHEDGNNDLKLKLSGLTLLLYSFSAIGDPIGELIEQNAQTFEQISANFATHQIQENISLLCRARDNIMKIMNSLSETPEVMSQMPPLPVKVNEELANSILPRWQS
ncbi:hypothetical protein AKJ16_DCAP09877 [Drosera capensis]